MIIKSCATESWPALVNGKARRVLLGLTRETTSISKKGGNFLNPNRNFLMPPSRSPWPPQGPPRQRSNTPEGPQGENPWKKILIVFLVFVAVLVFLANLRSILASFQPISQIRSGASPPDALQGLVHVLIIVVCIAGLVVLSRK